MLFEMGKLRWTWHIARRSWMWDVLKEHWSSKKSSQCIHISSVDRLQHVWQSNSNSRRSHSIDPTVQKTIPPTEGHARAEL